MITQEQYPFSIGTPPSKGNSIQVLIYTLLITISIVGLIAFITKMIEKHQQSKK